MLFSVIVTLVLALAVIGVFCVKAVRLDRCKHRTKCHLIITGCNGEKDLEMLVKSCYWEEIFTGRENARDIILVLDRDQKINEKAKQLEQEFSIVHCVTVSELAGFLGLE